MASETVRPDETVAAGGATASFGTLHGATSDDNDGTWIIPSGAMAVLGFDEPALAATKAILVRVRCSRLPSGTTQSPILAVTLGGESKAMAVSWSTPTTVTFIYEPESADPADVELGISLLAGVDLKVYEAYLDFVTPAQPAVDVTAPSGAITDTNRPTVAWTDTLDIDGGEQTHYEVKIFNDTQYGAGGFDPDASIPARASGIIAGDDTEYQHQGILADDTYRAYVRVAQTVDGERHWSDWEFEGFTSAVDLPGDPEFTLTPQSQCGRMRLNIDNTVGDVTTDGYEIQRSDDAGETWAAIRTVDGDGLATNDDRVHFFDWEAANGAIVRYRVRSIHDGLAYTDWVEAEGGWESRDWWFKHPTNPSLNIRLVLYSLPGRSSTARRGVFTPLGSPYAVVVSDVRSGWSGEMSLIHQTDAERDALDAMLATQVSVLFQKSTQAYDWSDPWVALGDLNRTKGQDHEFTPVSIDAMPWVETARPTGNLVGWDHPCPDAVPLTGDDLVLI